MGPADSRRIPRVPRYSGAASAPLRVSPTGLSPPMVTLSCVFGYPSRRLCRRSYNPGRGLDRPGLGSCAFARHYWRNHCYFLFLRVLRCFSSPRFLLRLREPQASPVRPFLLSLFLFAFRTGTRSPAFVQGAAGLLCSCRSILALCFQRGSLNPR